MIKLHLFRDEERAKHAFYAFKDQVIHKKGQGRVIVRYRPSLSIILTSWGDTPQEIHYFKSLDLSYNRLMLMGWRPDEVDLEDVGNLLDEIVMELHRLHITQN